MDLDQIVADAQQSFEQAADITTLENEKARFLGKSGALTELLKGLGKLDPEARKTEGARINVAKQQVEAALTARRQALADALLNQRLTAEAIDVTLPGRGAGAGSLHPVMRTWERVEQIFGSIGFDVADGPEIETDWYNFTSLNSPENHPARSMQDTFYVEGKDADGRQLLLRTHTVSDAGALRAHEPSADQGDRAGPHVSRRQRCDPLADVQSGRGAVDRRKHQLRRPQGRLYRLPENSSSATTFSCASVRRISRSRNRRPRST